MSSGSYRSTSLTIFRFPSFHRASIPFQQAHHLVNPWNDHKKVQISRDGQVSQSYYLCRWFFNYSLEMLIKSSQFFFKSHKYFYIRVSKWPVTYIV